MIQCIPCGGACRAPHNMPSTLASHSHAPVRAYHYQWFAVQPWVSSWPLCTPDILIIYTSYGYYTQIMSDIYVLKKCYLLVLLLFFSFFFIFCYPFIFEVGFVQNMPLGVHKWKIFRSYNGVDNAWLYKSLRRSMKTRYMTRWVAALLVYMEA